MELAIANDPLARQYELDNARSSSAKRGSADEDPRSSSAKRGSANEDSMTRPHKPTLEEMGPHNREIPLAGLKKGRPRSKAGKPGTHSFKKSTKSRPR